MSARRAVSFAGRWKTKDPFCPYRGLIRMSWDKLNVYNLAIREKPEDNTRRTVFQQKWTAKRELRAYHGPDISEKQLLNRHWNNKLPMRHLTASERERLPPVQALAFGEVERRLDVALFRAHFASSLPMAKMFVTDGKVKVNGVKCKYPPRRLLPGDMVTIDPRVIPMLHQPRPAENAEEGSAEEGATEEVGAKEDQQNAEKVAASESAAKETSPAETTAAGTTTDGEGATLETPAPAASTSADSSGAAPAAGEAAAAAAAPGTPPLPAKKRQGLPFRPVPWMSPFMFTPAYLEVSYPTTSFVFLRPPLPQPDRVEIPSPHPPEMHALAYEWYSSIRRRSGKRAGVDKVNYPLVVNGAAVKLKPRFERLVKRMQERDMEARNAVLAEVRAGKAERSAAAV